MKIGRLLDESISGELKTHLMYSTPKVGISAIFYVPNGFALGVY